MRKGIPFIISAPSGAGKSTLSAMLLAEFSSLRFSISCTTRPMRNGEVEGRDYYFLNEREFIEHRNAGAFAEWAEVHGNFYGTLRKPVLETLISGKDVLFDIDVQGAARLKLAFPAARFVFIIPPSLATLEKRLRERGQDQEDIIQRRLAHAKGEISQAMWYDYLIVNEDLKQAYDQLRSCYMAATLSPWAYSEKLIEVLEDRQHE